MFVIMRPNGDYIHRDGKIILFESREETNAFLTQLTEYSIMRLQQEGRMEEAMFAPMTIANEARVFPVDFDVNAVECGVIYAREMKK